jgi:hypothetical protein
MKLPVRPIDLFTVFQIWRSWLEKEWQDRNVVNPSSKAGFILLASKHPLYYEIFARL